ncbi:MAG: GAF domain-containing protein, partial [Chloroflexota bacterium]|nr:GAF domain-containing protein [Chloroflexota bacterium]
GYAGAESINITFFDETRQSMVIAADSTITEWPGVEDPGTVLAIEPDSLQDRALRLIKPQHYSSTMADLGKWELDDIEEYGAPSWICAPLRVGGRAIGLLQVLARQPDAFDQRRIRLWDEVAQQVSLVISTLQVSFDNQRLSRHQELLTRINAASGSSSSAAEVYRTIAETGLSLPGVESSALFLWYEEDNLLEAAHHAVSGDWFTPYEPGTRMTPAAWLVGDAPIRRWETTHIWLRDETLPDSSRTYLETIRCGRAALFMLIEEGNVLGVLSLKARDDGPFPEETINLAESIATASAAIVRNVRARTADRQAEREQTALLTLSRAATASASEEELLEVIVTSVRDLADARGGAIFFLDAETGAATVVANVDPERGMLVSASGLEHGQDYWTVELARRSFPASTIVQDLTDERLTETMRAELTSYGVQSIAWIPLSAGDRIIGLIAVYSDQPRRFTTAVTRSVATFAGQAALALEHTRQRLEDARLAEQRALLLQVSRAAGISLDLKQVLAGIAEASLNVARSESCGIELYLPETDELVLSGLARVNDWVIAEDMSDKTRPYGSWSIDYLVRTHGSVVISSIDDPRIQGTMREDMTRFNTQSIMAHALSSGGQFIGIYYLFARKPNAYAEGDRWLTGEIATHIVAAIQNARLLEQEQTTAQERERLLHISEAATRSLDLHDVLHEIAQATLGLAGAESCHVELIDHERSQFITAAYAATDEWAAVDDVQIGDRCRIGDWSIDMASITSREPTSIGSKDDPRVAGQMREDMIRFGTESILFIPIWLDDVCVGILNIYSRRPNAFSTAHLTIASTLGTHAANAIQNAQTHERERERRRHQEALLTVTSAATSSLDVNIAMHEVCKAICKVADAESAVVGVFHPEMNAFEIVADVTAADWDYADEPGRVYPLSGYPSYDRVLSSPSAFVVDRTTPEDDMRAYIDNSTVGLETYVLAPLYVNETCLGYVGLFDRRPGQFGRPVLELMDAASQLVGLALSNGLQWREEQRRAADRAAVVAVGRIAVSEGDVSTKLDRIATTCLALHRIDGVAIFQWEPIDHTLTRLVSQGTAAWLEHGHPCERYEVPGDHELRKCVESPEPSRFELADPDLHPQVRKALGECGAESLAIFPLRTEERIEGILVFYGLDPYPFDSETLSVGREIATQTALTMRASRLLETAHTYARQQSALLAANQAVMNVTQSSIAEVLETISRETMRLLDAECCEIERLLPEKDATKIIAEVSIDDWFTDDIVGKEMPLADWPITRRVLYSQQAVTLSPDSQDLTPDEWEVLFSEDTRSVIMAPMVLDGQSCGAICFYSRKPDAFTSEKLVLAREFGSLVALAIDRAETHMALAQRAMNDGLTGLLNHRALVEQIDHHIAVAARTEVPVSLLMIDMNNFKQVNDEHGHLAGDEVLRQTATFLRRTLRASDLVGRYGGDEFVAILPGTDVVQAISLRERLQESAKTLAVLLPNGSTVVPSFAIGYSSYPGQADDAESLIEVADRSMYEAKSHVRAQKAPVSIAPVGTDTLRVVS